MIQRTPPPPAPLFDHARPIDPNVRPADTDRLTGQNAAILERLRTGPATNVELAAISLKYTSRISDLRANGHSIVCRRGDAGVNEYVLETRR